MEARQKVTAEHLKRNAYLYVRQSTMRQVLENTESAERQYALRGRAIALGWPEGQVVVIDGDQARSGATTTGRVGFQELVSAVGLGHAGIVMGLEVSRLARNNADWHRLLEICALSGTLILDEDGIYDPTQFNDRLLLGLKGTMSEAELHVLRARLRGGLLNKARRGELRTPLPVGLVYDSQGRVVLDPDKQVQESIRHFFQTFRQTGAASATARSFRRQGLEFPRRLRGGPGKGELVWGPLDMPRAVEVLRNPRYAGAFVFGRRREKINAQGRRVVQKVARENWHALVVGAHVGYLCWEEYEANQNRLRHNAQAVGAEHRQTPPREGPALLQGLVLCGRCGAGMTVRYHARQGRLTPEYLCQRLHHKAAGPLCQNIPGAAIDEAIGRLLVETVTPVALEVALAVEKELQSRIEEADRLRYRQVERAHEEAELARRRFMQVHPDNRLVADTLEAEWNGKLRAMATTREEYERRRQADRLVLDEEKRARVLALASDFPRLWNDPNTPQRERKRMVRLLIEDATLVKDDVITVHVRFKGGATKSLTIPRPLGAPQLYRTPAEVVAQIDRLMDQHTYDEIAAIINERGLVSGCGKAFDGRRVAVVRRHHGLRSRYARLREAGWLTLQEVSERLGLHPHTVKRQRAAGKLRLRVHRLDDVGRYLYEDPGRLSAETDPVISTRSSEVQYAG